MSAPIPPTLRACLEAAHAGDEAGYLACVGEDTVFYGGITGLEHMGIGAILGAFRAGQDLLRRPAIRGLDYYGDAVEGALRVRYTAFEGRGPSLEGFWHVRFSPEGRIQGLALIWNPSALLADPPSQETLHLPEGHRTTLEAYFQTFNEGQDGAHLALLDPAVTLWGSGSHVQAQGISDSWTFLKAARTVFHVHRIEPREWFGKGSRVAVVGHLLGGPESRATPAAWIFHLGPDHRIRHLSVLWRPTDLLA